MRVLGTLDRHVPLYKAALLLSSPTANPQPQLLRRILGKCLLPFMEFTNSLWWPGPLYWLYQQQICSNCSTVMHILYLRWKKDHHGRAVQRVTLSIPCRASTLHSLEFAARPGIWHLTLFLGAWSLNLDIKFSFTKQSVE